MHVSTFEYLNPTDQQKKDMQFMRERALEYGAAINTYVPEGPDKTYIVRKLREVAMWVNIAITRLPNGQPRIDD